MVKHRPHGSGSIETRARDYHVVRYELGRDRAGKRIRRSFVVRGTLKQANRALREAQTKRDHGVTIEPDLITLAEYFPQWLEQHRAASGIAESTQVNYESIIRVHLVPFFGKIRLQDLDPSHVRQFQAHQRTQSLARTMMQLHHIVLRRALQDALRHELIGRNVADVVGPPKQVRRERRALEEHEIVAIFSAAAGTELDMPLRVLLATGVRIGELLALTWADLDLDGRTIRVERTARYLDKARGVQVSRTKSPRSRRTIELSAATVAALRGHRQAQAEWRLRCGAMWDDNDLVSPDQLGRLRTPPAFGFAHRHKAVLPSGVADPRSITPHTWRHTAASQWIRHGADVYQVSRRLGHASVAFTLDTYAHLLKGQQRESAEALDHLIAQG